jgi:hypothetical protein
MIRRWLIRPVDFYRPDHAAKAASAFEGPSVIALEAHALFEPPAVALKVGCCHESCD